MVMENLRRIIREDREEARQEGRKEAIKQVIEQMLRNKMNWDIETFIHAKTKLETIVFTTINEN